MRRITRLTKPTRRRRRTDAARIADMQAELARLKAAGEAKVLAGIVSKPAGVRTTRGRLTQKRVGRRDDHDPDAESSRGLSVRSRMG